MEYYLTLELNGGSLYRVDVPLTKKEFLILECKGNGKFQNHMWDLICDSINQREKMTIQGNYNLISYTGNGKTKIIH